MGRPYGLLRAGFPYVKTLGMRRLTNFPVDVALGKDERLYVLCRSEGAAVIRKYNYEDEDLGTVAAFGKDDGQLTWPVALISDRDENLFVSDEALHRITSFDKDGKFIAKWGEFGDKEGQFNRPSGIAFDADENIYVSDTLNHRIQKYTKDGKFLTQFGGYGEGPGQLNMPWGIAVDELGDVYVADWRNDRVQRFTAEGEFVMEFGRTGCGDGGFNRPTGVAVDADGDIYVADRGNDRVQLFNAEGRYVQKFLGDATLSKVARDYMLTNAGPNRLRDMANLEPQKYLRRPTSVTVDEKGRMFVPDNGSYRVQVYQKDVIHLTPEQFGPPVKAPTLNQE
ncbi:MAG: NHL repeat-containing protein [Chloroflexi bacterium]|nr:NHL repeat-containing protein [Chloroflexota bacterium]